MTPSSEQLRQLADEYVLGTLPLALRREVERRLPGDAPLRDEVDAWERRLLPLTALAAPVPPSPQLWPRIAADLRPPGAAAAAAAVSAPARLAAAWRHGWDDLRWWRGLAGAGLAASVALAALLVAGAGPGRAPAAGPAYMVVLMAPRERSAGWVVQASLDRKLTLTPLHGTAVPSQKALQFWTKGPGWNGPVSLGLVAPDRTLKLGLDRLPPLQPDQLFEITLEPQSGSPTGKPTGPVLYIGKAVKVM